MSVGWVEESFIKKNHCAKIETVKCKSYFKSVLSTQRGTRSGGHKKMHSSAIYKGYALYKIDGESTLQQQNSCGDHLPQISSRNSFYCYSEICYLFFYCMFFLSMFTFLFCLCACLRDSVGILYIFHLVLLPFDWTCMFLCLSLNLCISALLDIGKKKSKSKDRKQSNRRIERAGHEQDSNSQTHMVCKLAFQFIKNSDRYKI